MRRGTEDIDDSIGHVFSLETLQRQQRGSRSKGTTESSPRDPSSPPILSEVRQGHWGTSRRCKQAGNAQSIKNLTKDVSGAGSSPMAVNNLTAGTGILPGQALPSLSGIPTGNPVPPARQHFSYWHLCLSHLLCKEGVTACKMAKLTATYLQKHQNKRKNIRSWKTEPK